MSRRALAVALFALLAGGCATEGTVTGGAGFYGDWYYGDDIWYGGGCCVDVPPGSGAHPEHPIALPPDGIGPPRPENPIALPPKAEPKASPSPSASSRSAAPRMSAMPRGGGGRGGRR